MSRKFHVIPIFACGCAALTAQTLAVSPAQLAFTMLAGGPKPQAQTLTVTASNSATLNWTANVPGDAKDWAVLSAASGTTPSTLTVGLPAFWVESQAAGTYNASVVFTPAAGATVTINVTVTAVARNAGPNFNYLSGPNNCRATDGYMDQAICNVPGEKPPGAFAPPAAGATYADPNFGATIRMMTNAGCNHDYSTPSATSAHGKYVMVVCQGAGEAVDTATGKPAYQGIPYNWNHGTFWDAYNDDIYYYLDGTKIQKYSLSAAAATVLVDYSTDGHGFTGIEKGGTGDTSKDNWVPFWAPTQHTVCALDLNKVKTYCADYTAPGGLPYDYIDFSLITRGVDRASGKRYVLLMAGPAMGAFSVNTTTGKLDFEYRGPEDPEGGGNLNGLCDPGEVCLKNPHADVFEDSDGTQYLVFNYQTGTPCEFSLNTFQLNKGLQIYAPSELGGGRRKVMTVFKCQSESKDPVVWTEDYVACARSSPFCVISTTYGPNRDPADQTPIVRTPHLSETFVMRGNGLEIRRLAENRSILYTGENPYWSYPRTSISNDGRYVVADSNFGTQDPTGKQLSQRVMLIDTGYGKPQIASSGIVNAASFDARLSPGAVASIYGTALADCGVANDASATDFPLPDSLCYSSVTFNGTPAPYYFASPGQLNVIVPGGLASQSDINVVVSRTDGSSDPLVIPAAGFQEESPGIFSYTLDDNVQRAAAQNASDYSLNGPARSDINSRPLRPGEIAILYANALGPTVPSVPDGHPAPLKPLANLARPLTLYVNGISEPVTFAGLTPGLAGLYQLNFSLTSSTPINGGDRDMVWLDVNGFKSGKLSISLSSGQ